MTALSAKAVIFCYKSISTSKSSHTATFKNMDPLKVILLSEKYIDIVFRNARKTSKKNKF